MKRITIWVVTPHEDSAYDEWWGPAETEADHVTAMEYAKERLEWLWDGYVFACDPPLRVTMEQRVVNECDLPWYEVAPEGE